jgi:glycosyltransferase involved in cell wall biosynthesis
MEGIGFMVLEPVCSGLPVITTNYPPMNEYVQQADLRCRTKWFKRTAFATKWIPHAHLKPPSIRDLTRRMEWAAETDMTPISMYNRKWAEASFEPRLLRETWFEYLDQIPTLRLLA